MNQDIHENGCNAAFHRTLMDNDVLRAVCASTIHGGVTYSEAVLAELECVLCGDTFIGGGHNPYPLAEESWFGERQNRCCSACNLVVVAARMAGMKNYTKGGG